jgi:hypothetical protein
MIRQSLLLLHPSFFRVQEAHLFSRVIREEEEEAQKCWHHLHHSPQGNVICHALSLSSLTSSLAPPAPTLFFAKLSYARTSLASCRSSQGE